MIVAVTGYRNYGDWSFIFSTMNKIMLNKRLHIRVGDAEGADAAVRQWCAKNVDHLTFHVFAAERFPSGALKPGAGPRRNWNMLTGFEDPTAGATDLLLGFPRTDGGRTAVPGSGTWGCMIMAAQVGIEVRIPPYTMNRRGR